MQLEPYLFFSGNCEEALTFYKGVFGGNITSMNRYGGSPMAGDAPAGWDQKVMHASFEAGEVKFMAADSSQSTPDGNNARARLCVGAGEHEKGRAIFDALAAGGSITVPYEKQFWGASFGMLVDRFGLEWMVNAGG
ncbi:MAG: VOC family protein [Vulcanimicrobiaceae bacterium]|jgi:PhnB protein